MKNFPDITLQKYEDIREQLQSGDLLLASGEYMLSKLIQRATGSCWSHVAFIMRLDSIDRVMVLESIEGKGVRTVPLSEYVMNFEGTGQGYKGRLAIARHSAIKSKATTESMRKMAQFAVDRFARPYDEEEIARIISRIVGSALGFTDREIERDEEYICSEYVFECFGKLGIKIASDNRGFVSPADFSRDKEVKFLWEVVSVRGED